MYCIADFLVKFGKYEFLEFAVNLHFVGWFHLDFNCAFLILMAPFACFCGVVTSGMTDCNQVLDQEIYIL